MTPRDHLRLVGGGPVRSASATAHNLDAEVAILSAVIEEPATIAHAAAMGLDASHFYSEPNGRVWQVLGEMSAVPDVVIHTVTVAQQLKDRGYPAPDGGWTEYLSRHAHMAAPLGACVELVIELADVRAVQAECRALAVEADGAISDRRAWALAAQERITSRVSQRSRPAADFATILTEIYADFDAPENQRAEGKILGYATGFQGVDRRIGGMVRQEVLMLTGPEKSGKSSLGAQWCANVAHRKDNVGALILQWEDPRSKTAMRIVGARARVDLSRMRTGLWNDADHDDFTAAANELGRMPLKIEDECAPKVLTIGARVRAVRDEWRAVGIMLGVVMIDSVQALEGEGQNREQQIENIMKGLVALKRAKDLADIAWLVINHTGEDGQMVNARRAPARWLNTWIDLRVAGREKEAGDGSRPAHLDVKIARDVEAGMSIPLWVRRDLNNRFVDGGQ